MHVIKNPIKAIIFDMDGVLINSEPIHIKTWQDVVRPLNLYFEDEWFEQWIGTSDETVAKHFSANYLPSHSWQQLLDIKRSLYIDVLNKYLKPSSLMVDSKNINKLKNYTLGVATSSSRSEVIVVLQKLNLSGIFKVIVTGEDVIHSKPSPDIYLLAADKIKVNPINCIAIEDSPYGIQSAKQAGMFVIGISSSFTKKKIAQADIIFNSTTDAIYWLSETLDVKRII